MATTALQQTQAKAQFVHLRTHSAYSLLEGALQIEKLAKLAKADGQPALALTDTGNLFGALEFSEKLAGMGVQPIIGSTLAIDFGTPVPESGTATERVPQRKSLGRVGLLAKGAEGYAHLMQLSSRAYLDTPDGEAPHIRLSDLRTLGSDLICLTGGPDGPIDLALAAGQAPAARAQLEQLSEIFGDRLYVELQRHGLPTEQQVEPELIGLAYSLDLPLVASNEPYFATPDDYEAHDVLICVAEGSYVSDDNRRRLSRDHCFKSQSQMAALFSDLPEAVANTIEIARRCAFRPTTRKPILPQFVATKKGASAAEQNDAEAKELKRQAEDGLRARLQASGLAPSMSKEDYWNRLDFELSVITGMQFQGYFLIVADFIKWAKAQKIPVGPGRGSGAGSVVAWSLTITDLDPMRFGLLFERFLNPSRVSMPDFDIDFCQERRDEVIRYVQEKYGKDRVAQIITYGKLQARAVLRDVGRVLQMPFGQVDRICKLVPSNPANPVTLAQAIEGEPRLQEARDEDPLVGRLFDIAQKLEGLYRHASTHAAGIVIGDRPLIELVPLYRDPRSDLPATQFNLKWVEAAGLVKFDFLGLKTLTVLQKALDLLRRRGVEFDLLGLALDDKSSYELLSRGDTVGVFQLEGQGMRDSLRRLKPNRFEDIIAMVSLYRPGPMDNIPTYINRKHGIEKPDYLHPMLEPVLKETYGVIIYQEQVQQIAKELAGYSLGEADLLRRAMGKKIKEEMAQQKTRFVEGAVKNGVDPERAAYIFELVDKFAGYGFNKSHAAAYALIAYHTAYLKAKYPVEFLAASMTLDLANTDKLAMFVEEARRMGIKVLPPSINHSAVDFMPEDGAIRYSLAALKNIGAGAVTQVTGERDRGGRFKNLGDFAKRLDAKAFNKRSLETLAAAGGFDQLDKHRGKVFANADNILAMAQRTAADRAAGQNDLFGTGGAPEPLQLRAAKSWPPMEALGYEFDAVGFYLSGHPLDEYEATLKKLGVQRWLDFEAAMPDKGVRQGMLAGVVVNMKERRSKSGNRFAFAGLSDQTGQFEAVVFSDVLTDAGDLLAPGQTVLMHVEAEREGESVKLRAQLVQSLDKAAGGLHRGVSVVIDAGSSDAMAALNELPEILSAKGTGQVRLFVRLPDRGREAEVKLQRRVAISPQQVSALRHLPGVVSVREF